MEHSQTSRAAGMVLRLRNERPQGHNQTVHHLYTSYSRIRTLCLGLSFWTSFTTQSVVVTTTSAFSTTNSNRRSAFVRSLPVSSFDRTPYPLYAERSEHDSETTTTVTTIPREEPTAQELAHQLSFIKKILAECGYRTKPPSQSRLSTFHWLLNLVNQSRNVPFQRKATLAKSVLSYVMDHPSIEPPTVQTLHLVLTAYHAKHQKTAGRQSHQEATEMFRRWQDWYQQGVVAEDVNLISYNKLMIVLSRSSALADTEQLFEEMQQRAISEPLLTPDIVTYGSRLFVKAMNGRTEEVIQLLEDMVLNGPKPSLLALNDILHAYSTSAEPQNALTFFRWWEKSETLESPNSKSYNVVLRSIARSAASVNKYTQARDFFDSIEIQKDSVTYTTMIGICARNIVSGPSALRAIMEIVNEAVADHGIMIDNPFLANVIYSLAASNDSDAPLLADQLFQEHGRNRNNIFVYEALAFCWSKSTDLNAKRRVMEILDDVENHKSMKPTVKLYTNVILALKNQAGQEDVKIVEDILTEMETNGPSPTVATYAAAIGTVSRSNVANRAAIALSFLQRMKIPPNIVVYNSILNVCEYSPTETSGSVENLRIACNIFVQARNDENVQASHVTYGSFISTLGRLMEPSEQRDHVVLQVFRQCCREGQVSPYVVQKLKATILSAPLLRSAFEDHGEQNLPHDWTRNVRNVSARFQ